MKNQFYLLLDEKLFADRFPNKKEAIKSAKELNIEFPSCGKNYVFKVNLKKESIVQVHPL